MKALRFSSFGDMSAVLHIEGFPTPVLAPDEVLVKVHAASINPSDVKNVQGKMKQTTLPRTPGPDLAAIVVAGDKEIAGKQIWAAGGASGQSKSLCPWLRLPAWGLRTKAGIPGYSYQG